MSLAVKTAIVVVAGLVLAGCAGTGNQALRAETEQSVATKLEEGKTTKAEVRNQFGSPAKTEFTDGGLEVWRYEFTNVSADAVSYIPIVNLFGNSASGVKKELVVLFNEENIVRRYSMSESDVAHRTGVFKN